MAQPRYLITVPLALVPWLTGGPSKAAEASDPVWSLSMAAEATDAVRCKIRTTAVPGGVQLQPVASAGAPIAGTYEFVATSRADGSTSNTSQSGTFDLGTTEERVLGSTTLSVGDGTSYEVHLTFRSDDQNVICRTSTQATNRHPSDNIVFPASPTKTRCSRGPKETRKRT